MATKGLYVQLYFPHDEELTRKLDAVGAMDRFLVLDKCATAAGKIILAAARKLAPRSKPPDLRSAKQKSEAKWGPRLYQNLGWKVVRKKLIGLAIIGPKWPEGSKAYFNVAYKKGSRQSQYWNKDGATPSRVGPIVPAIRNWMLQARDETKEAQLQACRDAIDKFMKEWMG